MVPTLPMEVKEASSGNYSTTRRPTVGCVGLDPKKMGEVLGAHMSNEKTLVVYGI